MKQDYPALCIIKWFLGLALEQEKLSFLILSLPGDDGLSYEDIEASNGLLIDSIICLINIIVVMEL